MLSVSPTVATASGPSLPTQKMSTTAKTDSPIISRTMGTASSRMARPIDSLVKSRCEPRMASLIRRQRLSGRSGAMAVGSGAMARSSDWFMMALPRHDEPRTRDSTRPVEFLSPRRAVTFFGRVVGRRHTRSSFERNGAHALRHPLLRLGRGDQLVVQGARRRGDRQAHRRAGELGQGGAPGSRRPPHADHHRQHLAQGEGGGRARRPLRRDQGAAAGLLRGRVRLAGGGHPGGQGAGRGQFQQRRLRGEADPAVQAGSAAQVSELGWIDLALRSARPRAMGALLRYFRDLDIAKETFQEACLGALKNWPQNGPPRDPAAWLIFVGRNAALDSVRRRGKERSLPDDEQLSDLDDAEGAVAEGLDSARYRDDILRLLFICCHPELPSTQQIALALRIVCGLTVKEIARAFLVSEDA